MNFKNKKKKNYFVNNGNKNVRTKNFKLRLKLVANSWKKIGLTLRIWFKKWKNC